MLVSVRMNFMVPRASVINSLFTKKCMSRVSALRNYHNRLPPDKTYILRHFLNRLVRLPPSNYCFWPGTTCPALHVVVLASGNSRLLRQNLYDQRLHCKRKQRIVSRASSIRNNGKKTTTGSRATRTTFLITSRPSRTRMALSLSSRNNFDSSSSPLSNYEQKNIEYRVFHSL